eukprot:CAMPEP_0181541930 /NCGR_PEP_ID=MMETSP1110-20121109/77653_1 /TAXON_ID=174948 /ORGANISM="Symbiodinium sp., Strain CCMP421" /LENGTH=57 /DNA_ID=CAMNT_0023673613 /DNA_START=59 /DNA_END=232 /DNA_ORIENTATION=+
MPKLELDLVRGVALQVHDSSDRLRSRELCQKLFLPFVAGVLVRSSDVADVLHRHGPS